MAEAAAVRVLLEILKKLMIDEAYFLEGVKGKINQLQSELEWMYISIKEADRKRKSDEKMKLWVKQIRGIAFDAEDVIDEFALKIVHHKRFRKDSGALTSLRSFFISAKRLPFLHEIGNRLTQINTKAEKLKANKDNYWVEIAQGTGGAAESSDRVSSLSLQQKINLRRAAVANEEYQQDDVQIHGDSARRIIKSLLIGDGGDDDRRLRVISILGMGGAGKTTLSKKVYIDNAVKKHFNCRAFVYISKAYSLQELLKSIIRCFNSISGGDGLSCEKLREHLQGKKYLIVLDDIWDTNAWDELRIAFPDENNGSRVLLTTRHKHVAVYADDSSLNTNIHKLAVINETESWELFLKKVFPLMSISDSKQFVRLVNVEDLGKQMVEKCYGLPLAIVVLGSLLSSHEKERAVWSRLNDRASWLLSQGDESYKCSGILALSYDYLPIYLKPCFLYMSLFPEHSLIRVTKLLQYWIAEGFVIKRGEETLEDTAEDYLEELIRRSLIQVGKLRCDGRIKTCSIHDLLRDISITESKEDQFSQIYGSIDKFYQEQNNSRRVAVYCKHDEPNTQCLSEFRDTHLRFLMCRRVLFAESNYLRSLFGAFKSLRVLEFNGCKKGFVSLPKEVGELIHLRYLSLEKTKLERINTSYLIELVNLQTLNLRGCIGELMLDGKMWSLSQLRHIYLDNITSTENNRRRQATSAANKLGIGNLTNLQLLVIQAGDWIYSGGLKKLISLRVLRIEECLNSHSNEISNAVANFTNLQSLALISKTSFTPLTNQDIPLDLASIQFSRHTSLTRLHLKGHIDGWRHISFPPNIWKLKLEWSWIQNNPMLILEKFPSLTFLHLGFDSYLGKKLVCSKEGFSRLQTLEIVSLENLEEWKIEEGALKSLANLEIRNCEKLEMIPDGVEQLTTLISLRVVNMPRQFHDRLTKEVGEDWNKIKHVPADGLDVFGTGF